MALALELSLLVISVAILAPALVVVVETLAALVPQRAASDMASNRPGRVAVLVPAHNEEAVIAATVSQVLAQLRPGDTLLVVADNCTDATAEVARRAGATVAERHDALARGKGHALAFGRERLAAQPPDVVIIVDADCDLQDAALSRLAGRARDSGQPVQSVYLMTAPEGAGPTQRLAQLAIRVKNLVRPLGAARLGLPCQLAGSGMAFPWDVFSTAPLASSHLVEDLQLGLDLSVMGNPPLFCPEATVTSKLPQAEHAQASQRRRWEHGHLHTMARAPGLALAALRRGNGAALFLVVDMVVPPLSLLVFLLGVHGALAASGFWFLGLWSGWLVAGAATFGLLFAMVLAAWARFARDVLPARVLMAIPLFLILKIPVYIRFLFRRQKAWIKTDRDR